MRKKWGLQNYRKVPVILPILLVFDGCKEISLKDEPNQDLVIFSTYRNLTLSYQSGRRQLDYYGSPIPVSGFNASFAALPCIHEYLPKREACNRTVQCDPEADSKVATSTSICKIRNQTKLSELVLSTYSIITCTFDQKACPNSISRFNISFSDLGCLNYFRCQNNKWVERSSVCDDNSCNGCLEDDEWQDGPGFRCVRNGKICRIPQSMVWDKVKDCDQGEDLCFNSISEYSENRDLRHLPSTTFNESMCYKCLDQSMIIPRRKVCDGIIDCPDLSDECLCEGKLPDICADVKQEKQERAMNTEVDVRVCDIGQVSCGDGTCINRTAVCDSIADCQSGKDEKFEYCGVTQKCNNGKAMNAGEHCRCSTSCSSNIGTLCDGKGQCPPPSGTTFGWSENPGHPSDECDTQCLIASNFTCKSNISEPLANRTVYCYTINGLWEPFAPDKLCNGVVECKTGRRLYVCEAGDPNCYFIDEEKNCHERFSCKAKGLISIRNKQLCDGVHDCDDGSDEWEVNCTQRFYCSTLQNTKVSIDKTSVCDQTINCDDGSDEVNCTNDGRFYCESKIPLFVPKWHVFDGNADCSDASDECPLKTDSQNENVLSSKYHLIANPVLRGLVWIMALLALTGNAIVFVGEARMMRKLFGNSESAAARTTHMLILNLAVADFLMGVYLMTLAIAGLAYSGVFCRYRLEWLSSTTCTSMGVLVMLSSEASVITMVLLTSCRLYAVLEPFKASRKPKGDTLLLLILGTWLVVFSMALIPLAERLQFMFANTAFIPSNPFFDKSVVSFESAKSWANRAVTYEPSLAKEPTNVLVDIESAGSWKDLKNAVQHLKVSSSFNVDTYFGYYSLSSVCISRIFVTTDSDVFGFSFAITAFNFIAFMYILTAYVYIAVHTAKQSRKCSAMAEAMKSRMDKRNKDLQKRIARLLVTDFCCWVPLSIIAFLKVCGVAIGDEVYAFSAIFLLPINSALNPILYSNILDHIYDKLKIRCTKVVSADTKAQNEAMEMQRVKEKNVKSPKAESEPENAGAQNCAVQDEALVPEATNEDKTAVQKSDDRQGKEIVQDKIRNEEERVTVLVHASPLQNEEEQQRSTEQIGTIEENASGDNEETDQESTNGRDVAIESVSTENPC